MVYRQLFKRAFKCVPLLFAISYLLFIFSLSGFVLYKIHARGGFISDKVIWGLFPILCSTFILLAWGIAGTLKADICRSSTSMLPHFRRKQLNFFLSFGIILGTFLFVLLLNPIWDSQWLRHLRIILPLGLFLFSLFLFLTHIFPYCIGFLGFLGFLGAVRNYPTHFGLLEPLSYLFLLITPFLIWQYRAMMLNMKDDSRFYRTMPYPGFGTSLWKVSKRYAAHTSLMKGPRWLFDYILKFDRYRQRLGKTFPFLLIILRNNCVAILNPLSIGIYLLLFASIPSHLLTFILPISAGSIVLKRQPFSGGKLLPMEILKPLSRKKFFLTQYFSYYVSLLFILLFYLASSFLRPYNPLYHWFMSRMRGEFFLSTELSVMIAGAFFLISFLLLFIRQAYSLRNSILVFYLGIIITMVLAWLSQKIGIYPILFTFSVLTVMLLSLALRLDCRKDV